MLPVLIARAVDRALSRCAPDDPPRVVALRVGWAVLRELELERVSGSPVTGRVAAPIGATGDHPADKRRPVP